MSVSYHIVTAHSNETQFIKNKVNLSNNWRTIQFLRTPLNSVCWLCTAELGNTMTFTQFLRIIKSYLDIVGLWNRLGSETWQSWEIIPVLTRMNGIISRMSGNRDAKNLNLRTRDVNTGHVCLRRPNAKQWHLIVQTSLIEALVAYWLTHSVTSCRISLCQLLNWPPAIHLIRGAFKF